jgi:hypothetical protein
LIAEAKKVTDTVTQVPRSKWRKFAMQGLIGGVLGATFSILAMELVETGLLGTLGVSQQIALLVGVIYGLIGLMCVVGVALPGAGVQLLNVEDADELREQRQVLGWSGASMVLMGVLLAVLGLSGTDGVIAPATALTLTLTGWVVLTFASIFLLRQMDELMRSLTRETGELAYYLMLLACGGWALLAWLGYAPAMGMLDFLTLNHVLLLLASVLAAGRRGLMKPR